MPLQVLPALALVLLVSEATEARRVRIVGLGALGYAFVLASTMTQTYAGRSPLELTAASTVLAAVGLLTLAVGAVLALRGLLMHARPPVSPPPVGPAVQSGAS